MEQRTDPPNGNIVDPAHSKLIATHTNPTFTDQSDTNDDDLHHTNF